MKTKSETRDQQIELESFFPYLVRIFYRAVSSSVTDIYATHFNLSVSEWRTMAVLGTDKILSASEIVERSSMDKVNVSRAVKALQQRGFLKRDIDGDDKRKAVLRLTEAGKETYRHLIPLLLELENQMFEGLSDAEISTLISLMAKVRKNADRIPGVSEQINSKLKVGA